MRSSSRFVLLALAMAASSPAAGAPFLRVVQPFENANIPAVKQSFVFGSVLPATASLTINGVPVKPYTNGGFLAMIPFEAGHFKIEAVADDGVSSTTVIRYVNVDKDAEAFPEDGGTIAPIAPRDRRVVRSGDILELAFQGAPGGTANFKLGAGDWIAMQEQPSHIAGIYRGTYVFKPGDHFDGDDVTFRLKRKDGKKITQKAGASVIVQRRETPRIVELKEDAILLTGPEADLGYNLFAVTGVRMEVTGESGEFVRVSAGDGSQIGWVRKSTVIELPAGTPLPRSVSRNVRVIEGADSTLIEIPLQQRHLHRVEQFVDPHSLRLTLWGVTGDTDRIRYSSDNSIVREITWFQPDANSLVFDIRTRQREGWGYDVRYEGTTLQLEIRHAPKITPSKNGKLATSLRGLRVAVDAGHSTQNFGTIGPWANTEAAVNVMAAKVVKQELERRGAEVILTQDGTKEISLQDRVLAAWKSRAQIFISLHCDAVPEGQDPRESQGYSVHYFHPQSQPFAETLHRIYGEKTGIRDGGLWRSNLAVCRTPTMPSVLLEMGFLVLPEGEEQLISPQHHALVAKSVANALSEAVKWER